VRVLAAVTAYADPYSATEPSCNGTDTSLAIYAPGSCSPIGYSQLIGESRLCGGVISDGFTTGGYNGRYKSVAHTLRHAGCHQNNVSIELDYVTVPDGTTYSKCTSLKEPITCGKCEYRVFYRVQSAP
jgi:hypothetical protein